MQTNINLMKSKRTVRMQIKRLTLCQHSRVSVENERLSSILKYYHLNKEFVKIRSTVCYNVLFPLNFSLVKNGFRYAKHLEIYGNE